MVYGAEVPNERSGTTVGRLRTTVDVCDCRSNVQLPWGPQRLISDKVIDRHWGKTQRSITQTLMREYVCVSVRLHAHVQGVL